VLVVGVLDEAGMLGDLALVMSKAGINIDSVYVTTRGHIVLGVDDMAGAIQSLVRWRSWRSSERRISLQRPRRVLVLQLNRAP